MRKPDWRDYPDLAAYLLAHDEWVREGMWVPAHNGTEEPFYTRSGRRLLYCYQPRSGRHAYLDCQTDLILTDDEARLALGNY